MVGSWWSCSELLFVHTRYLDVISIFILFFCTISLLPLIPLSTSLTFDFLFLSSWALSSVSILVSLSS